MLQSTFSFFPSYLFQSLLVSGHFHAMSVGTRTTNKPTPLRKRWSRHWGRGVSLWSWDFDSRLVLFVFEWARKRLEEVMK